VVAAYLYCVGGDVKHCTIQSKQLVTCYNADNQLAPPKLNRLNRSNAMTMTTAT